MRKTFLMFLLFSVVTIVSAQSLIAEGLVMNLGAQTVLNSEDINSDDKVDIDDSSLLSSDYKQGNMLIGNYVTSKVNINDFNIFANGTISTIVTDSDDFKVCHLAADILAGDIELVCGTKPQVTQELAGLSGHVIFVNTLGKSKLVDKLVAEGKIDTSDILGQWETFILQVVDNPMPGIDKGLFIIGSDRRATAFGAFDLSESMGVSPWHWWADVPVKHRNNIVVKNGRYKQGPPSVKYRGIFINDEDWGLHPWARDNYAPEDQHIGPKTYKAVFELLLRMKANYIWPGMHECTKAFNAFPENKLIADDYAIVIGSAHCEQMLRNNVWEWYKWQPADGSARGDWDWCTNSDHIVEYWKSRVQETAPFESMYTLGMRGVHDSDMPCSGSTTQQKAQKMRDELLPIQRQMLIDYVNPDPTQIAQIFCPYKEVLDLYDIGLNLPDDVSMLWPDDNYGYIRRLSNSQERERSGGSGVYYHISYLGNPHDFLWLCTTPPSLIWEEMSKAYEYNARDVWIVNVGDIKPGEMCTEFFLDLAWDINKWDIQTQDKYIEHWAWREFGPKYKKDISKLMLEFYRLGQARKPEHMGWPTEWPELIASEPEYSVIHYGDETQKRIDDYKQIETKATEIYESLSDAYKDSFYELVLYPVRSASLMTQKYLYSQKSRHYAAQGRISANTYAQLAIDAHNAIIEETRVYNKELADGKWDGMMSWNPRGYLPVYGEPKVLTVAPAYGAKMGVVLEGQVADISVISSGSTEPFADDFVDGVADGWNAYPGNLWQVIQNGELFEYRINTSNYSNQSGDSLGAISIVDDRVYDNFHMTCLARSLDSFSSNPASDLAIVFGYVDEFNYSYIVWSADGVNTALHRITNGVRSTLKTGSVAIPDNGFHSIDIQKTLSGLSVTYDGQVVFVTSENFAAGKIGVGSYNDSAAFTAINVESLTTDATTLPEFNVFTKESYFVDIFNKGDTKFRFSATPSADWIKLDKRSGSIIIDQRVQVSIDWNNAPLGESLEKIEVTGAGSSVSFNVKVSNPVSPRPESMDGFVESNGYVSIEAENYTNKIDRENTSWQKIPSLGRTGDTMAVVPAMTDSMDIFKLKEKSPVLEYKVNFLTTGIKDVVVYSIPTHAVTSEHGLRYAVAFDNQTPKLVDYDALEWASEWNDNVMRGAAISKSVHTVPQAGEHTLKIWMVDPGVVLDKIVIGETKPSYLGPPETKIVK